MHGRMYGTKEGGVRGGVVPRECPQHATLRRPEQYPAGSFGTGALT